MIDPADTRVPVRPADDPISAAADRPARAGALSASRTFAWRGLLKIKHVPEQLGDVIGIPILFTVMFTYLFGGALAPSTGAYLQYLLPGTMVMAVSLVTVYAGVTLNTDVSTGAFDRFRSMPIWPPAPVVGGLIGDVGRYLLASSLVIALGMAMGFRPAGGAAGVASAVALVLVFALSLSWLWTTLGLLLRTPNSVQIAGILVLLPLTFASNVFVSPRTMPGWLRTVVDLNPVSHLATAARSLMAGTFPPGQVLWVVAASAALTVVFAPLTLHLYGRDR
jgi:daunorubicin/doxorubicin transport system permease protein